MPKLRLKRTPEEEAAHRLRKKRKKEEKKKKRDTSSDNFESSKWPRKEEVYAGAYALSDEEYGISDYARTFSKADYDTIRESLEEKKFRENMSSAFEDDDRLDSLEARFNDYAHVPQRWRSNGRVKQERSFHEDLDDYGSMDPKYMDDEEYAEWIRIGMYRKTHADEYADHQRKKALHARYRESAKALRRETERLEKAAELQRQKARLQMLERARQHAREQYEMRWKELLSWRDGEDTLELELNLNDIPWPIFAPYHQSADNSGVSSRREFVSLEHFNIDAISEFLLPPLKLPSSADTTEGETEKRGRKEKLRETFLRFHPDKFEGRFMKFVEHKDRDAVREAIGQVARSLNILMNNTS